MSNGQYKGNSLLSIFSRYRNLPPEEKARLDREYERFITEKELDCKTHQQKDLLRASIDICIDGPAQTSRDEHIRYLINTYTWQSWDRPFRENATINHAISQLMAWKNGDKGLFIQGATGLGKTYALKCLAVTQARKGLHFRFRTHCKMVEELMNRDTPKVIKESYLSCHGLIIDDFALGISENEYTTGKLFEVLNTRLEKKLPTFFSCNLVPQELQAKYPAGITSRIKALADIALVTGPSYRDKLYAAGTKHFEPRN